MKSVLASLLLLVATAVHAEAPKAVSVEGKWNLHSVTMGQEADQKFTFVQKESELTGTCEGASGKSPVTGKVEGGKITWTCKVDYQGNPITLTYEGKLDGDAKLSGTLSVQEFGVEGEFTATQAK